jgi:catechol 2,3-dioxygenase-like lactoylglutathione lyase family enzyme
MPIGHLGVNVTDLVGAKGYFDDLMPLLAYEPFISAEDQFSYQPAQHSPGPMIFFYPALETGTYSRHKPGLQHLAFVVPSRAMVDRVFEWAKALDAEIIHPPQEFPQYHEGYYATFWYGPEGFMLEAVCHRDLGAAEAPSSETGE